VFGSDFRNLHRDGELYERISKLEFTNSLELVQRKKHHQAQTMRA